MKFGSIKHQNYETESMRILQERMNENKKRYDVFRLCWLVGVLFAVIGFFLIKKNETLAMWLSIISLSAVFFGIALTYTEAGRYLRDRKRYKQKRYAIDHYNLIEVFEDGQIKGYQEDKLYCHFKSIEKCYHDEVKLEIVIEGRRRDDSLSTWRVNDDIEKREVFEEILYMFMRMQAIKTFNNDSFQILQKQALNEQKLQELIEKSYFIVPIQYHFENILPCQTSVYLKSGTQVCYEFFERDGKYIPVYTQFHLFRESWDNGIIVPYQTIKDIVDGMKESEFFRESVKIQGILLNPNKENIRMNIES